MILLHLNCRLLELEGSLMEAQDQVAELQAKLSTPAGQLPTAAGPMVLPHMACSNTEGNDGGRLAQLSAQVSRLQSELSNALTSKQVCVNSRFGGSLSVRGLRCDREGSRHA